MPGAAAGVSSSGSPSVYLSDPQHRDLVIGGSCALAIVIAIILWFFLKDTTCYRNCCVGSVRDRRLEDARPADDSSSTAHKADEEPLGDTVAAPKLPDDTILTIIPQNHPEPASRRNSKSTGSRSQSRSVTPSPSASRRSSRTHGSAVDITSVPVAAGALAGVNTYKGKRRSPASTPGDRSPVTWPRSGASSGRSTPSPVHGRGVGGSGSSFLVPAARASGGAGSRSGGSTPAGQFSGGTPSHAGGGTGLHLSVRTRLSPDGRDGGDGAGVIDMTTMVKESPGVGDSFHDLAAVTGILSSMESIDRDVAREHDGIVPSSVAKRGRGRRRKRKEVKPRPRAAAAAPPGGAATDGALPGSVPDTDTPTSSASRPGHMGLSVQTSNLDDVTGLSSLPPSRRGDGDDDDDDSGGSGYTSTASGATHTSRASSTSTKRSGLPRKGSNASIVSRSRTPTHTAGGSRGGSGIYGKPSFEDSIVSIQRPPLPGGHNGSRHSMVGTTGTPTSNGRRTPTPSSKASAPPNWDLLELPGGIVPSTVHSRASSQSSHASSKASSPGRRRKARE